MLEDIMEQLTKKSAEDEVSEAGLPAEVARPELH